MRREASIGMAGCDGAGGCAGSVSGRDNEDALYGIGVRYQLSDRLRLFVDATYSWKWVSPELGVRRPYPHQRMATLVIMKKDYFG